MSSTHKVKMSQKPKKKKKKIKLGTFSEHLNTGLMLLTNIR